MASSTLTPTQYENLIVEHKGAIARVTVNRPKVLNALNMATMEELRSAFTAIKEDKDVRVALLTGSGEKAFIAGADIGELSKHDAISGKEYTHKGQSVLEDRKSTRLNSSHSSISYAVFCLKK